MIDGNNTESRPKINGSVASIEKYKNL